VLLLAHALKQHNSDRSSQIQAAGSVHWNTNAAVLVDDEQILREPFCFRAEHEKITALKSCFVVRALALCRQKKIIRTLRLRPLQGVKGIPEFQAYVVPIIEACSFQLSIIERKTKRLDQMQRRLCGQAKPTDVACVWRNLRPDQDNIKQVIPPLRFVLTSLSLQIVGAKEEIKEEKSTATFC
jgi:hypothetical protein